MPEIMDDDYIKDLSNDVKYMYRMAKAISAGVVPVDLANVKPGPMSHARWLTRANRIMRLYVSTNNPSKNLKTLTIYVMKVYVPMYFSVKYYNSVVYGSALLFKFISWTRYLENNVRGVVDSIIRNNSYFAHPENIILSMLFDDRKSQRDIGIRKILYIRDQLYDPTKLRQYRKHEINFECAAYTDMVDMTDDDILSEPPFTTNIAYEHLVEYLDIEESPFCDPNIPMHIQSTERHVQLLTSVSKRVLEKNREGVMAVTLEAREKVPRMESKKDLQK